VYGAGAPPALVLPTGDRGRLRIDDVAPRQLGTGGQPFTNVAVDLPGGGADNWREPAQGPLNEPIHARFCEDAAGSLFPQGLA